MSSWHCSCGSDNDANLEKCPFCGTAPADVAQNISRQQRIAAFRKGRAQEEILVHERRDINSPVVGRFQKGDRVALGQDSDDDTGQKWIEVQTTQGALGFALKSSRVSVPSPALGLGFLGIGAVLLVGIVYVGYQWIRAHDISISKLAMLAVATYGAYAWRRKRR